MTADADNYCLLGDKHTDTRIHPGVHQEQPWSLLVHVACVSWHFPDDKGRSYSNRATLNHVLLHPLSPGHITDTPAAYCCPTSSFGRNFPRKWVLFAWSVLRCFTLYWTTGWVVGMLTASLVPSKLIIWTSSHCHCHVILFAFITDFELQKDLCQHVGCVTSSSTKVPLEEARVFVFTRGVSEQWISCPEYLLCPCLNTATRTE